LRYRVWGICFLFLATSAAADIYTFIDSDGVIHFTNVPTSSNYRLYIRESPAPAQKITTDSKKFDDLILKAEAAYGIDFSLIKAMIKVESGFNHKAVSRVGAKGLMQIMPQNYASLYIKDPFDPEENIMGGVRYLQHLLDRYENKLPLALAAYNAGPEAVDRYQQIPPYKETREYVRKVMELYRQYKNS